MLADVGAYLLAQVHVPNRNHGAFLVLGCLAVGDHLVRAPLLHCATLALALLAVRIVWAEKLLPEQSIKTFLAVAGCVAVALTRMFSAAWLCLLADLVALLAAWALQNRGQRAPLSRDLNALAAAALADFLAVSSFRSFGDYALWSALSVAVAGPLVALLVLPSAATALPRDHLLSVAEMDSVSTGMLCPITQEVMVDPVTAADGFTYERGAIEEWFRLRKTTSPMTGQPLASLELLPNHALRRVIREEAARAKSRRMQPPAQPSPSPPAQPPSGRGAERSVALVSPHNTDDEDDEADAEGGGGGGEEGGEGEEGAARGGESNLVARARRFFFSSSSASASQSSAPVLAASPASSSSSAAPSSLQERRAVFGSYLQAKQRLMAGAIFLKYGRRGDPKRRFVVLRADGAAVEWFAEDRARRLGSIAASSLLAVLWGRHTSQFKRFAGEPAAAALQAGAASFSLVAEKRTLDLECASDVMRNQWASDFELLIRHVRAADALQHLAAATS